jgi:hypothetical protein
VTIGGARGGTAECTGQVDGVGDHRRRGVGLRGGAGEDRHGVGDAERVAAPSPAARGDPADGIARPDRGPSEQTRLIGPIH